MKLKFCLAIIYEASRLYSIASYVPKIASESCVLRTTSHDGSPVEIPVEQGTVLLLSIDAIHMNRELFDSTSVEIYLTRNRQPVIGQIHMSLSHPGSWRETKFITLELSWRFHLVCARVLAVGSWLKFPVISVVSDFLVVSQKWSS